MSRLLVENPDTYQPPDLRGLAERDRVAEPVRVMDWQRIAEERQALLMASLDDGDRKRLEIDRLKRMLTSEEASHTSTLRIVREACKRHRDDDPGDGYALAIYLWETLDLGADED